MKVISVFHAPPPKKKREKHLKNKVSNLKITFEIFGNIPNINFK